MDKGFNKLKSGIFIEDRVNEKDIEQLIRYKSCKTITLTNIKTDNLDFLLHLKNLTSLKLYKCKIDDYSALTRLNKLRNLFIRDIKQADVDLTFLSGIENLQDLSIGYVFHLKTIPDLSKNYQLKRLSLFNCKNLTAISSIKLIPNLETFEIVETPQKPEDLEFLMHKETLISMSAAFGSAKLDKQFKTLLEKYNLKFA